MGAHLVLHAYRPYRSDWDHDHCEFCGATFSCAAGDLKRGYSTRDNYHWVCLQCFEDFRQEFHWHLDE
jgi:hypothetical protein